MPVLHYSCQLETVTTPQKQSTRLGRGSDSKTRVMREERKELRLASARCDFKVAPLLIPGAVRLTESSLPFSLVISAASSMRVTMGGGVCY